MPPPHRSLHIAALLLLIATAVAVARDFTLSERIISQAEARYGDKARTRLLRWQELIRTTDTPQEEDLLKAVNDFFNRLEFVSDQRHWDREDYWATPVEFLASGGGDCEDFSLAKYFTLLAMGVAEKRLNLTYVKVRGYGQSHMVLTYYPAPGAEPLVLDNINTTIRPASRRRDLTPIYSFNGSGLWLAKQRDRGIMMGTSNRLTLWQDLLERMPEGLIHPFEQNPDQGIRP